MSYNGFLRCNSRLSKEEQQFRQLKNKAAEFYQGNGIPQKIECVLTELFLDQPDDMYGYLANYFSKLSAPPRISKLKGIEVYNAKGQASIEAEVFCIIRNEEKRMCTASISTNDFEENSVDPGANSVSDVLTALCWVNEDLSTLVKDCNPCDQTGVDQILSDFLLARYLEEQDLHRRERESRPPSEPEVQSPPPPPTAPTKDKKGSDKGKKRNSIAEKPITPQVPPEPVLSGSMAIGSVSLAVAKTGAQLQDIPLYKYIANLRNQETPKEFHIPLPLVTLLSCGKMSPGKLNLLEEVILMPKAGQRVKQITRMALDIQREMMRIMNATSKAGAVQATVSTSGALVVGYERPEQPLDLIADACSNLGLALGTELHLAVNCAAHELMDYSKGKYDVVTGGPKSADELVNMYEALMSKYPSVVALIDPLRKEDVKQWEKLNSVIGASCSLLADVSYEPLSHGMQPPATPIPGVKGFILKQTNEMSISDLIRITTEHQGAVIMGMTFSEPCCDASLSDLAVGLGVSYVKLGGLSGAERLTKYNRLISIEEKLAQQGILDPLEKHTSSWFAEKTQEQSTTMDDTDKD